MVGAGAIFLSKSRPKDTSRILFDYPSSEIRAAFRNISHSLGCRTDAFFLRHPRQLLDFIQIYSQSSRHALSVLRFRFVENRRLPELNAFLRIAQMSDDISDQVIPILVCHHLAI